ncbi:MAG: prepilin peptidase leader peptidase (prepilin peptidase) / N-methyltransferase [Parcubacteria group bacterium]|nr:prepilin peptidase leader peptidase (prepilin peptidase) / N-methyltransferase [Parcubacteria group bacterium]
MGMITVFLFVLGLIVGSFLNVVALRYNSGTSIGGRSFCFVCKKRLRFWELVPVVSFVGLGGRCSECKTGISYQYPLVELITGLVFVSVFYALLPLLKMGNGIFLFLYVLAIAIYSIYIVIGIYDLRHKIIPDGLVYATLLMAFVFRLSIGGVWIDWLAGPILFAFFALIWLISRGRAMGFGDAKLALSIGIFLGGAMGFSAFVLAFWIGTAVTLLYMAGKHIHMRLFKRAKPLTMKTEVPFAPFLIIGALGALVFHLDLFHVLSFI